MKEMPEALKKEKWIEIIVTTPSELVEPLSNFITELGTDGIIEEELDLGSFKEKPEPASEAELKAYLPWGSEAKKQIGFLKKYILNLSKTFPKLAKPTFITNTITDPDWGEQWKKYFKPLKISKNIVIKPTWERFAPLGRDIVVDIDPGMAFGTGTHDTTRLCREALAQLFEEQPLNRVLDVGTGSGILAIAAAALGAQQVVACDIEPESCMVAAENARLNQVDNRVQITDRALDELEGNFQLVLANILAEENIRLAPQLVSRLAPGGSLVLSGMLVEKEQLVIDALRAFALDGPTIVRTTEWSCLSYRKKV